jgi:hypothetical protein
MLQVVAIADDTALRIEPAFQEPPHIAREGLAGWITYPPGGLLQFTAPTRNTSEVAAWLVGPAYDHLVARFPDQRKLILVLDLGLMTGRSAAARSMFLGKAKECSKRFARGCLVPPRETGTALLYSVRAVAGLISALGIQVDIVDSSAHAIALCKLRPAPR